MLDVETRLSSIEGLGLFAGRAFRAGERIHRHGHVTAALPVVKARWWGTSFASPSPGSGSIVLSSPRGFLQRTASNSGPLMRHDLYGFLHPVFRTELRGRL